MNGNEVQLEAVKQNELAMIYEIRTININKIL